MLKCSKFKNNCGLIIMNAKYKNQIKTSENFFKKEKLMYSNWGFSVIRELFQNSIDAGASLINVEIIRDNGELILTFIDDGCGMTEDVLLDHLLCLGGTNKDSDDMTGGFGAAKKILFFAHNHYKIKTLDNIVDGSGDLFNIGKLSEDEYVNGSAITISLSLDDDDQGGYLASYQIQKAIQDIINLSAINREIHIKSESMNFDDVITMSNQNGIKINEEIEFIYDLVDAENDDQENESFTSGLPVLVNGLLSYIEGYSKIRTNNLIKNIRYNINGKSVDYLTVNRDGLNSDAETQFRNHIEILSEYIQKNDRLKNKKHPNPDRSGYVGTSEYIKKQKKIKDKEGKQEEESETSSASSNSNSYYGYLVSPKDDENTKIAEKINDNLSQVVDKTNKSVEEVISKLDKNISIEFESKITSAGISFDYINGIARELKGNLFELIKNSSDNETTEYKNATKIKAFESEESPEEMNDYIFDLGTYSSLFFGFTYLDDDKVLITETIKSNSIYSYSSDYLHLINLHSFTKLSEKHKKRLLNKIVKQIFIYHNYKCDPNEMIKYINP